MSFFQDLHSSFPTGVPARDSAPNHDLSARLPEIVIVTGQSGAGRTRAAAVLEDLDWYVVDNLPPRLLTAIAGMVRPEGGVQRLAVVVDVRSGSYFEEFQQVLDQIREADILVQLVFIEAKDQELVRRYEQSRRPHPLQGKGTLLEGIEKERKLLAPVRERADVVLDTTNYSVHDLARKMREIVATDAQRRVNISVVSFGFKYGLPMDANHVLDVRFIPNPYWVNEIRNLTGKDKDVSDYVFKQEGVQEFVHDYVKILLPIFAGYERELKPYVTLAVGCTGGKHRSVAITEKIAELLRENGIQARAFHRDIGRE